MTIVQTSGRPATRARRIVLLTVVLTGMLAVGWALTRAIDAKAWERLGWGVRPDPYPGTMALDAAQRELLERAMADPRKLVEPAPDAAEDRGSSKLQGRSGRKAKGTLKLLATSDGLVLRLEDFEVDNGPDLRLELSPVPADAPTTELRDGAQVVGRLPASAGALNVRIPVDSAEAATPRGSTTETPAARVGSSDDEADFESLLIVDGRLRLVFAVAPLPEPL
ncbi:MAG: hypothetical protein KatS3mg008_0914 [Acidimicrobiales bacterium]|nr:MAG: hypothetical protein KatS3mg008_0914 [Acidimicrobiales bacterium]